MVKLKCGITDRIMPFLLITNYFNCCKLVMRWEKNASNGNGKIDTENEWKSCLYL